VAIVNAQAYAQEQETARKLRQLERLRVQSLGSMSHELATALNSIIGFSRIILKGVDGPLTDLQRTDLTAIHQSGHHLLSMLDNVLDLVDLESGTLALDRQPLDVNDLIEDVLATTQTVSAGQIAALRGVISPNLPPVPGDGERLRQVLIHLIAEAAEEAETVVLSAHTVDELGDETLLIRIVGLPSYTTPPEPTELAAPTDGVVWGEDGASLRVALSRRIVELHGGRMWMQPASGRNRVYVLLLPTSRSQTAHPPHES
jgi:K+-sensing histidine kinase KdpD